MSQCFWLARLNSFSLLLHNSNEPFLCQMKLTKVINKKTSEILSSLENVRYMRMMNFFSEWPRHTRRKKIRVLPPGVDLMTFRLPVRILYHCATGVSWELRALNLVYVHTARMYSPLKYTITFIMMKIFIDKLSQTLADIRVSLPCNKKKKN